MEAVQDLIRATWEQAGFQIVSDEASEEQQTQSKK
jgi:hypothetical protein